MFQICFTQDTGVAAPNEPLLRLARRIWVGFQLFCMQVELRSCRPPRRHWVISLYALQSLNLQNEDCNAGVIWIGIRRVVAGLLRPEV